MITRAETYVTRSKRSVAVVLHGPLHDHPKWGPMPVIDPCRIYLPMAECQHATEPRHFVNLASHKARPWMDDARAELWYRLVVDACRPMRAKCKPLLQAISTWCRNNYGPRYWRNSEARAALRAELSLMGIKCPPDGPALDFRTLATGNRWSER